MVGQLDSMMAIVRRTMTTPLQPDRPTDEASQELGFRAQSHMEFEHYLANDMPQVETGDIQRDRRNERYLGSPDPNVKKDIE